MAEFNLTRVSVYPKGTTVKAYPVTNWPTPSLPSGTPIGSSKAEAEMGSEAATFTGLLPGTAYFAHAKVSEVNRYVRFETGQYDSVKVAATTEAGENDIISAVTGKRIRVHGGVLTANAEAIFSLKDSATTFVETTVTKQGGYSTNSDISIPSFTVGLGKKLTLKTGTGQKVYGRLTYELV